MSKGLKITKEEYSTLGDFVLQSFTRDQDAIMARFPKMNASFKAAFEEKLEAVKTLESGLVLTEAQKNATASLYAEVAQLNKELNFLSAYLKEANLNVTIVTDLKKTLLAGNVEGAILKIESVKQYVEANAVALIEEGMSADFATTLMAHKSSLATKNTLQNTKMNAHKTLTSENRSEYKALYEYIAKIIKYGKLVFDGDIIKDEYTVVKILSRMRAAQRQTGTDATTNG